MGQVRRVPRRHLRLGMLGALVRPQLFRATLSSGGFATPTSFLFTSVAQSSVGGDLGFVVTRTKSNCLPVYSDFKNGRTRHLTVVRRIRGDVEAFEKELSRVCGGEAVIRKMGRVEVKGDHRVPIMMWLKDLGF